jgi:hypothetical protein
MNIDDIWAKLEEQRRLAASKAEDLRIDLAIKLHEAGVRHVTVEFDGSGDQGQIYNICIEMEDNEQEPEWAASAIEEWCYGYLEGTGIDWYNNDGGFGLIEFVLETCPGAFSAEISQRSTESKVVHSNVIGDPE